MSTDFDIQWRLFNIKHPAPEMPDPGRFQDMPGVLPGLSAKGRADMIASIDKWKDATLARSDAMGEFFTPRKRDRHADTSTIALVSILLMVGIALAGSIVMAVREAAKPEAAKEAGK